MNNWVVEKYKLGEWNIEEIALNFHHEFLVYKGEKNGRGEWFRTLKDALRYVADKINY